MRLIARLFTLAGLALLCGAPVCGPDDPPGFVYGECAEGNDLCCGDGQDNDNDTHIDCADKDCLNVGMCSNREQVCDDGLDNDMDSLPDCADPDCSSSDACGGSGPEICQDGLDNDGNNDFDCADSACISSTWCQAEPSCFDATDDDTDGAIDCQDPGCAQTSSCWGEVVCNDGIDNDNSGQMDLADQNCQWTNDNVFCSTGERLYSFQIGTLSINDNATTTHSFDIPMTGRLFSFVMEMALYHQTTNHVLITLQRPGTTPRVVVMNRGTGVNFLTTTLRDGMGAPIASGSNPFNGNHTPETAFSSYVYGSNRTLRGSWDMIFTDSVPTNGGYLEHLYFGFCVDP